MSQNPPQSDAWRLCVAPMMDWTTTQCRMLHRALSPSARLYTEMVHANAVVLGDRSRLLAYDPVEHPLALQLGGSEPAVLAEATRIAIAHGFDEVNLNCGCPSDRVQSGRFGACLMLEPDLVAACVRAMIEAADGAVPITVKCRIGVDDQDDDADLHRFVAAVSDAGCRVFIVHARKAWLKGLSPRENREIPPLNYPRVYRLKQDFPDRVIVLNGGLVSVPAMAEALEVLDGVMLGRVAWHEPYMLALAEQALFPGRREPPERVAVLRSQYPAIRDRLARGETLGHSIRPMLGLYQGLPGARKFRRILSEGAHRPGADEGLIEAAIAALQADHKAGNP